MYIDPNSFPHYVKSIPKNVRKKVDWRRNDHCFLNSVPVRIQGEGVIE
jgi:hypothetical protein